MLELKIYQRDTLDAFSNWVEALKEERKTAETTIEHLKQVNSIRTTASAAGTDIMGCANTGYL